MPQGSRIDRGNSSLPLAIGLAVWLALGGLAAAPFSIVVATPAHAQEGEPRQGGGLLRYLFGRNEQQQPQLQQAPRAAPPQQRSRQRQRSAPAPARSGGQAAAPSAPASVEKSEDAKRVLVVGDFLAGGLADGLREAYAENAEIAVVSRSNGSSGLVRDDFFDWPGEIGGILEAEEPDAVIVMIGSNDRQQMVVDGSRAEPRSEAWLKEYETRISALTGQITERDLPFLWVGNLPYRPGSMSSDMIAFNDIYKRVVGEAGGEFVDIWAGFADENGAFIATGPDIKGQPVQLRAGDGINVTRAGRRKMAFFVEKPLERLLGEMPADRLSVTDPDGSSPFFREGESPAEIDRTTPVSLFGEEMQIGDDLLGASFRRGASERTEQETQGRDNGNTRTDDRTRQSAHPSQQPRSGRADDFGRTSTAPSFTPSSTPAGPPTAAMEEPEQSELIR